MTEHQKWLSRRAYHEAFSVPTTTFPNWKGIPNQCKCGCKEIWYDRSSPVNWWKYLFNLGMLFKASGTLFPVFRALHALVWQLPAVIWGWFNVFRATYQTEVLGKTRPNHSKRAAIATANIIFYGVVAPLAIALLAACWCLSRLGSAVIMTLHLGSLALPVTLILTCSLVATIAIAMRGIVFVTGGVASVAYSYYPIAGVVLIVVGVLVEYERIRRRDRRQEEIIGKILLSQNSHSGDEQTTQQ